MRQIKAEIIERRLKKGQTSSQGYEQHGNVQQIKYSRKTCVSLMPIKDIPNKILCLTCKSSPVMAD